MRKLRVLRALRVMFNLSHSALFACSPDGRFTHANESFLRMFGLADEEDARAHVFADFMSDNPLPDNFKKALAGETTTVGIVAETDEGEDDEELEITIAPIRSGRKVKGVAGSVVKV